MLSQKIQAWLTAEGGYIPGLALLSSTGNPAQYRNLKQYLTFPVIPDHAYQSLAVALRAYLVLHPSPIVAPAAAVVVPAMTMAAPLSDLHAQGKALLKERDAHRAQLSQMVTHRDKFTEKDRGELAHIIMTVQLEIDEVYQRIERYESTGELPELGSAYTIQQETIQKMHRMASLRSAISRLNKKLRDPEGLEAQQEMEAELLAKQVELKDLAEELHLE